MGIGASPFGATPFGSTLIGSTAEFFVGNWEPFLGDYIERLAFIAFEVLDVDPDSLQPVATHVQVRTIQGLLTEPVWNRDAGFAERYYRGSTRLKIAGGARYILRRTDGWLSSNVVVEVTALDLAGHRLRRQSRLL